MKTRTQAAQDSGISKDLINAVIRQLSCDKDEIEGTMRDIRRGGIDGGFHGFIYYHETLSFFRRHREKIIDLVKDRASQFGDNPVDFVCSFNCLGGRNGSGNPSDWHEAVARCLYGRLPARTGRVDGIDLVANALAWFTAEEVARAFED